MLTNANAVKLKLVWSFKSKEDFIERKYLYNGEVLDFGCNTGSFTYEKTIRDGGKYSGYDVDGDTEEWLKNNNLYVDFWTTEKKFDLIMLSNVYEHIDEATRESVIKRSYELLVKGGMLLIYNVFVLNLSLLTHWQDSTHTFPPPSPRMIVGLTEFYGFRATAFLVALNSNPFDVILNLCLKKYPQQTMIVECIKETKG